MKCRVVYLPSGEVNVIHPAPKSKREKETEEAWLSRVFAKCMKESNLEGCDYKDIDDFELPDRAKRNKWRGNKAQGLYIDETVVTEDEKRQVIENDLDSELEKETPDPVKVVKLQRKLTKREYD
jgi:hypothetical protein